jgi:WD40 repeat protein
MIRVAVCLLLLSAAHAKRPDILKRLGEWKEHDGRRLAFAPDGHHWAAGYAGTISLFRDDQLERQLKPGRQAADVGFSSDGKRLHAGPFTFDLAAGKSLDTAQLTSAEGYSVERGLVTPDGEFALVASRFSPARGGGKSQPASRLVYLKARSFELLAALGESQHGWEALAADEKHLAGASGHEIVVWDRETRKEVARLKKQMGMLPDLAFSPDGKWLATVSAGRDHTIILWDTKTWKQARSWSGDAEGVRAVAFHPEKPLLFTGGDDQHLKIWSLPNGKLVQSLDLGARIRGIAVSAARVAVAQDLPAGLHLFEMK